MNEAIYRSPKWLRNFIDFEVNTGNDIKGKPSKKSILKAWDEKWRDADEYTFKCFYSEVIEGKRRGWPIPTTSLGDIRKKYRGDMTLWDKFDTWLPFYKQYVMEQDKKRSEYENKEKEKIEKQKKIKQEEERIKREEQKKIENDLNDLFNLIFSDFSKYPYNDKISTTRINGKLTFNYKFEDGRIFRQESNKIYWNSLEYTVGNFTLNKFINLIDKMVKMVKDRPKKHPKETLYNTLKQTIKQREEQLKKMSKTDTGRLPLENELISAKRKLQDMKDKYKFEHLVLFESFGERIVNFIGKKNPNLKIDIIVRGGRIISIDNKSGIRFPFSEGQALSRNIEVWACNNNFYMDGKDTCPEKKIFGIRASDVPKGHEWRHIYPGKFK